MSLHHKKWLVTILNIKHVFEFMFCCSVAVNVLEICFADDDDDDLFTKSRVMTSVLNYSIK